VSIFCKGCGLNNAELKRNAQGENMCPACLASPPPVTAAREQEASATGAEPVLPYDVVVGGNTFRQGVKLSTFILAAKGWHRSAYADGYALTDEQKAANLRQLQLLATPTSAPVQEKP
jgi:hypothetical protein